MDNTFEHENDEPAFLLRNSAAIAADLGAWRRGEISAEAFEDAWGYDNPARCFRALIEVMVGPRVPGWTL